jgi:lactate permease
VRALLALLPFALVPILLATGRVSALASGLAGVAAALAAAALLQPGPPATVGAALARHVAEGDWLALQAALFIVAGLFFHLAIQAAREEGASPVAAPGTVHCGYDRRRLFAACLLLGPFLESATGFGVGQIMAVPAILAAGASGLPAVALSLLTQSLVAWGSLGVGSAIGAVLAGTGFHDLQLRTALFVAPVLIGHVPVFWGLLRAAGCPTTRSERLDDLAWAGLGCSLAGWWWPAPWRRRSLARCWGRLRIRVKSHHRACSKGSGCGSSGSGRSVMSTPYLPKRRMCPRM